MPPKEEKKVPREVRMMTAHSWGEEPKKRNVWRLECSAERGNIPKRNHPDPVGLPFRLEPKEQA